MYQGTNSFLVGQAGVYRVASELLLRGVNVSFPAVDNAGVDLFTEHGLKVQVKAPRLRVCTGISTVPAYYLRLGCAQKGGKHQPVRRKRKYSEEVDYLVIWGVDEDRFWIVPAAVFDDRHLLMLPAGRREPVCVKTRGSFAPFAVHVYANEGRWDLLRPEEPVISTALTAVS